MSLKTYNLRGKRESGRTLVGNWYEDRVWQDDPNRIRKRSHGQKLTAQPGFENKRYKTAYQKAFIPPLEQTRKVEQREAELTAWRTRGPRNALERNRDRWVNPQGNTQPSNTDPDGPREF
jgi:hypothetical protein